MAENKRLRAIKESWAHMSAYSLGRKKYLEGVRENPYGENDSLRISFQNGMDEEAKLAELARSRDFGKLRLDLLQKMQSRMRDPERTIVCDILANGALLPDPNGERYGRNADDQAS